MSESITESMTDAEWWEDFLAYKREQAKVKTQEERDRLKRAFFKKHGEDYDNYDPNDDTVMLAGHLTEA